jgi:hypothetical protein
MNYYRTKLSLAFNKESTLLTGLRFKTTFHSSGSESNIEDIYIYTQHYKKTQSDRSD